MSNIPELFNGFDTLFTNDQKSSDIEEPVVEPVTEPVDDKFNLYGELVEDESPLLV